mgnify:CR=1 FL=1
MDVLGMNKNCGHCHECGTELRRGLYPLSEWCSHCEVYRFYVHHGFKSNDVTPCMRSLLAKSITLAGREKG